MVLRVPYICGKEYSRLALKEVNIKVDKLPTSPQSLYKTGQEFKDRFYPNWARPHGNKASKFERFLEIGAETLKSCDKHIHLLS